MAVGKIAGQSTSAIARAKGVSRDWAAKELGSVECRQILVSLVNGTLERMDQLFKTVLDTIEAGMKADNEASAVGRGVGSPPLKFSVSEKLKPDQGQVTWDTVSAVAPATRVCCTHLFKSRLRCGSL